MDPVSPEAKEGCLVGAKVVIMDTELEVIVGVEDGKHFIANLTVHS